MNLTKYDKNTTSKMVIGQSPINEARKAVAQILIEIPQAYDLDFPEGSKAQQLESIADFILEHYRNISPNQIQEAMELNAARKFEHYHNAYGKMTREFIGGILKEFTTWRAKQRQGNQIQTEATKGNLQQELWEDWSRVRQYKKTTVTRNIPEKWDYLKEHFPGFGANIDRKKLNRYEEEIRSRMANPSDPIHDLPWEINVDTWAKDKYKAEAIAAFLRTLNPKNEQP